MLRFLCVVQYKSYQKRATYEPTMRNVSWGVYSSVSVTPFPLSFLDRARNFSRAGQETVFPLCGKRSKGAEVFTEWKFRKKMIWYDGSVPKKSNSSHIRKSGSYNVIKIFNLIGKEVKVYVYVKYTLWSSKQTEMKQGILKCFYFRKQCYYCHWM